MQCPQCQHDNRESARFCEACGTTLVLPCPTCGTQPLAGGKALPATVLQQIVAQTDGVPLFVEEITKTVLESDLLQAREEHAARSGPLPPLAIPATLQDALMARLDRLSTRHSR